MEEKGLLTQMKAKKKRQMTDRKIKLEAGTEMHLVMGNTTQKNMKIGEHVKMLYRSSRKP